MEYKKIRFVFLLLLLACSNNSHSQFSYHNLFGGNSEKLNIISPNIYFMRGIIDKDSITLILSESTVGGYGLTGIFYSDKNGKPYRTTGHKTLFMDKENYSISPNDFIDEQLEVEKHGKPDRIEILLVSDLFRIKGIIDDLGNMNGNIKYETSSQSFQLKSVKPLISYNLISYFQIIEKKHCFATESILDWNNRFQEKMNINSIVSDSSLFDNSSFFSIVCNKTSIKKSTPRFSRKEYDADISPNNSCNTVISSCNNSFISGFSEFTYSDARKIYWQELPFLFDIRNKKQLFLSDILILDTMLSEKLKNKIPPDYKSDFQNLDKIPLFITPLGITLIVKFKHSSEDIRNNFVFISFSEIADNLKPYFKTLVTN